MNQTPKESLPRRPVSCTQLLSWPLQHRALRPHLVPPDRFLETSPRDINQYKKLPLLVQEFRNKPQNSTYPLPVQQDDQPTFYIFCCPFKNVLFFFSQQSLTIQMKSVRTVHAEHSWKSAPRNRIQSKPRFWVARQKWMQTYTKQNLLLIK